MSVNISMVLNNLQSRGIENGWPKKIWEEMAQRSNHVSCLFVRQYALYIM